VGANNFARWISTPLLAAEGAAHVNWGLAGAATLVGLAGLGLGWALYARGLPEREYLARLPALYKTLRRKYFLDDLYEGGFVRATTGQLAPATVWFDRRVVDGIVDGVGLGTRQFARGLRHVQSGQAQWYAAALFVGVVGLAVLVNRFVGG
jgi:NADH-quinone oxidoreductase subunit L